MREAPNHMTKNELCHDCDLGVTEYPPPKIVVTRGVKDLAAIGKNTCERSSSLLTTLTSLPTFKIRITAHFEKIVEVDAENEEQALVEAHDLYAQGGL
jgi:hypothetical protein